MMLLALIGVKFYIIKGKNAVIKYTGSLKAFTIITEWKFLCCVYRMCVLFRLFALN